jgi:hypothetical protein
VVAFVCPLCSLLSNIVGAEDSLMMGRSVAGDLDFATLGDTVGLIVLRVCADIETFVGEVDGV